MGYQKWEHQKKTGNSIDVPFWFFLNGFSVVNVSKQSIEMGGIAMIGGSRIVAFDPRGSWWRFFRHDGVSSDQDFLVRMFVKLLGKPPKIIKHYSQWAQSSSDHNANIDYTWLYNCKLIMASLRLRRSSREINKHDDLMLVFCSVQGRTKNPKDITSILAFQSGHSRTFSKSHWNQRQKMFSYD